MLGRVRLGILCCAALGPMLVCAPARADVSVTDAGTLAAPASALVSGPDGQLWYTEGGRQPRIGRTTLLGVTNELALDEDVRPGAITRGPDGQLWFLDARGAVDRISVLGVVGKVAEVDGTPVGLAAGSDGNVWVTVAGSAKERSVLRVTPAGAVTRFGLPADPGDIAPGWDGALWFTEPKAAQVGRIDGSGAIAQYATPKEPVAITPGPDGAMWFTARNAVGRIDGAGRVAAIAVAAHPGDIALGADRAVWYTRSSGLGRIAPGGVTTYATPGRHPDRLAAGLDGAMYFTDAHAPLLGRITVTADPAPPALGRLVTAGRARGHVRVKAAGSDRFVALETSQSLPVGSVIDATGGQVRLTTATKVPGRRQRGSFAGGRFSVRQTRRGLTKIILRGSLACGRTATTSRRRHRRRLWASDSGGAFATVGLSSVTTVRGTKWLTEDRCGGTLTRVVRGTVVVRERATGRRFVLRAGQQHLARRGG